MEDYFISIVQDKRKHLIRKDGTYPIRLRVFTPNPRKQKTYPLERKFSFSEKDFKTIWITKSNKKEHKVFRIELQEIENNANKVADKLDPFSFEGFERLMNLNAGSKLSNVNDYFKDIIQEKKKKGSLSTALGYQNALDCLLRFYNKPAISFKIITVSFLEKFEKFCRETEEKTTATTGIYLRNLRTVFNRAKADKIVSQDSYPFGQGKFVIKESSKARKALTREQLKKLYESEPETPEQEKAKAFWFFSYFCNGMNVHDIIRLKCKDYNKEKIEFIRAKTEKTNKGQEPITVFLNDYSKQVINDFGDPDGNTKDFIFSVISPNDTPAEQRRKKQNFVRFINQHFLKYAKSLGINEPVSTYWARHSFSTMLLRQNEPVAVISEALGHTNIKTTMNYLHGFENDVKKEIPNKLLNF